MNRLCKAVLRTVEALLDGLPPVFSHAHGDGVDPPRQVNCLCEGPRCVRLAHQLGRLVVTTEWLALGSDPPRNGLAVLRGVTVQVNASCVRLEGVELMRAYGDWLPVIGGKRVFPRLPIS